jgi:hypothetical protein
MTGGLRMIKLVYVIQSRDDVPRAEFHRNQAAAGSCNPQRFPRLSLTRGG